MRKGFSVSLSPTPEAKVALDMLRAQATQGPYIHAGNMGKSPVRCGGDVVRESPLANAGRATYARAIDAWLASGGATPFVAPVRLAPADEARIHDGMAELCRQRQIATAEAGGGHPTTVVAGALEAALRRGQEAGDGPQALARKQPPADSLAKQRATWAKAQKIAAQHGREGDDAFAAALYRNLRADRLAKAQRGAQAALDAARAAAPADSIAALAIRRGAPTVALEKKGGVPDVARLDRLARAIAQLRQDQLTSMRPSAAGLKALLSATGKMDRPSRLAKAEQEQARSRRADTRQEGIDLCLLAQAHAVLALGGL